MGMNLLTHARSLIVHLGRRAACRQADAPGLVTFRLADAVPAPRLNAWRRLRDHWRQAHPAPHADSARDDYRRLILTPMQEWLDAGDGECLLRQPWAAAIVEDALLHPAGVPGHVHDWVIQPNHVHVLITPWPGHALEAAAQAWMAATTPRLNGLLQRRGPVWQRDAVDHLPQDPQPLAAWRRHLRTCGPALRSSRRTAPPPALAQAS